VVEAALARLGRRDAPLSILDLGTGSGCLLVALLHERPAARGLGVDRAPAALRAARANAAANGVGGRAAFAAADWGAPLAARFDLVVSNPPYIPAAEIAGLAPEVRLHDPRLALDGGADGLDAYRAILSGAPALLAPAGLAVLEVGAGQAPAVAGLAEASGLAVEAVVPDLAGHDRAVVLRPRAEVSRPAPLRNAVRTPS
jgi:release factor glutamine methyltransferase